MASPILRKFLVDVSERTLFTFAATFVALYAPVLLSISTGADWHVLLNLSFAQKVVVAGLAASVTVLKNALSTFVGDTNSAGFVPTWLLKALGATVKAENNPPKV